MEVNEEVLRKIFKKFIFGQGLLKKNATAQVDEFMFNNAPLSSFNDETKSELSQYYNYINEVYMAITKQAMPNIFYVDREK
jgi:hypothetical protein